MKPASHSARNLIASREAQLTEALAAPLRGHSSFALLDFTGDNKLGDKAIFLGDITNLEKQRPTLASLYTAAQ